MVAALRDDRRGLLVAAITAAGLASARHDAAAKRKKKGKKSKPPTCPQGVDQLRIAFSCPTPVDQAYTSGNDVVRLGQVFAPTRSGKLRAVIVAINVFNSPLAGDFLVQLVRSNDGVAPSAAAADVLAAVSVPKQDVPNGRSLLFAAFPSGPQVNRGSAYAFALRPPRPVDPEVNSGVGVLDAVSGCGSLAYVENTPGTFTPVELGFGFQFSVLVG